MCYKFSAILSLLLLGCLLVEAQDNDGRPGGTQENDGKLRDAQNSSSFVNAASDSKPREISLGLPTMNSGVTIFEDGLPVLFKLSPIYPYQNWHGGVSSSETGNLGPMETAMRCNDINYYVCSTNRTGIGEKTGGTVSYTYGHYGQHKLDVNLHGQLSPRGWYGSVSMYQNFDPGSNRLACTPYRDRHQFYKGVLSKDFQDNRGQMSLVVQYADYYTINEMYGPFVFVGDGSVKLMDGFDLGHDNYLPEDTKATFMDLETGEMVTRDINKDVYYHQLTATFNLMYRFDKGYNLSFRSRFFGGNMQSLSRSVSSISQIDASAGFTYADGTPFEGNVQLRNFFNLRGHERAWMNNAELEKRYSSSFLAKYAFDLSICNSGMTNASANTAHEVLANPKMLYLNGLAYYNFNATAQYYDGLETETALYAYYDWRISDRWSSEGFLRAGFNRINGQAANNIGDDRSNTRYPGYTLKDGKITPVRRFNPEWGAGFNIRYRITPRLSLNAEPILTSIHSTLADYLTATAPSSDPYHTLLLRGGLTFIGNTFNISAQLTYLTQDNKIDKAYFSHKLTRDVGQTKAGTYETLMLPVVYGISSLGLVTDANWNPAGGFRLHALLMLRNPMYRNFTFDPTFSDGVTEHYDFSGKHITAMPRLEFTLDPSYKAGKWNFWVTARYLTREYINKTNTLFFSGRFETFCGIDYALNDHIKFKLNVVNPLNQKGASGSISAADLVEDTSGYTNYLMAGKFIRPFTVEIGVTVSL